MEQSYPAKLSTFTSINSDEQSPTTICGQGYIYTGPLSSQCYQLPSKCVEEVKPGITNNETNNQYQFKVMLLGDSGVGMLEVFHLKNSENLLEFQVKHVYSYVLMMAHFCQEVLLQQLESTIEVKS